MGWFPQQEGGLNRVYYNLTRTLPGVGVDVYGLVTGRGPIAHRLNGQSASVQMETIGETTSPLLRRWRGARRVARSVLSEKPISLVASHFALYTFPLLDMIREYPVVVHFHGPWALEGSVESPGYAANRVKHTIEKSVYNRADRFIVLSDAFGDVLQRAYRIPGEKIRVVPGGVDVSSFQTDITRREARERLGWPVDRPILLSVRRLARRMGLENLIAAINVVRKTVPDVLLYIAGKGPLASELQEQVEDAGLSDHVRFAGFVPDDLLPIVYRAAELSIVPTVALEGFGLITIESLAAGTPVLVTPVGGLPEVMRKFAPDLILPDTKAHSIADSLTAILKGEVQPPSEEDCREYARSRYDLTVIAQQTRNIYDEVLA